MECRAHPEEEQRGSSRQPARVSETGRLAGNGANAVRRSLMLAGPRAWISRLPRLQPLSRGLLLLPLCQLHEGRLQVDVLLAEQLQPKARLQQRRGERGVVVDP